MPHGCFAPAMTATAIPASRTRRTFRWPAPWRTTSSSSIHGGAPLPREHGGPCRMITPSLYAWKGTKWIRKIEFLDHNQRGFWETRGYSDTAEPWFNDRYSSG